MKSQPVRSSLAFLAAFLLAACSPGIPSAHARPATTGLVPEETAAPLAPGHSPSASGVPKTADGKSGTIFTSVDLDGFAVVPECNPGGDTECPCSQDDVHLDSQAGFGEVTSNYRRESCWVNAIGHKSFTGLFPDRSPIRLGAYRYAGQFRIPTLPERDIAQKVNAEAVHLMIQLWDGRDALYASHRSTLEGVIFWELNPWSPGIGKIRVYTGSGPSRLVDTGIVLRPDLQWHSFELAVDFTSRKYLFIAIDGQRLDLGSLDLARVQHPDWGSDLTVNITTESMAAYPRSGCSYAFTWTTQFKDLSFGYVKP